MLLKLICPDANIYILVGPWDFGHCYNFPIVALRDQGCPRRQPRQGEYMSEVNDEARTLCYGAETVE